jgi:outer membrane protein assembly factor BamA
MIFAGRALAAVLALTLGGGGLLWPTPAHAQDLECDPGDREVRALEFSGNQAVSDDDLALRVITTPTSPARRIRLPLGTKRCLDPDELPRDVLKLQAYYFRRGFREARVDTVLTPVGASGVRVTFTIDEGAPTILREYEITGLKGLADSAAIVNATRLRAGNPFDLDLFAADKDTVVQRLRNSGYYHAQVFHQYNARTDSLVADASLMVVPGVRARFGDPVIVVTPIDERGQQIPDDVVKRLLGIVPGALYSDRAIVQAQRSLFALGTYRHIEVRPDTVQPPGDSIVVLAVILTEDYMRQLDSESGWATLDCGRVRLHYTDRNWLSSARRLELTGQASKIGYGEPLANSTTRGFCDLNGRSPLRADSAFSSVLHYHAGISVRQPRLLGFRWTPALSLYSERRGEYTAYLRTTYAGADVSAARDVGFRTPFRLAYTMEYGRTAAPKAALCALFNRCNPLEETPLDTLAVLGVASASLGRVRTDNPISPSRGYLWRTELRTSASTLLGTSPSLFFNKATGELAMYKSVGRTTVLAFRARAGAVVGRRSATDSVGFVPPQERLYAGGATSVRGFQQNELGSVVYIGGSRGVDTTVVQVVGTDTTFRMAANAANLSIDRTVPLGGNSLVVLNLDYRIRDPFLFPDRLQYTLFLDAGAVGTRTAEDIGIGFTQLKWTPGLGVRMLTLIGPVQVNVGYNGYDRERGPLYFNPNVTTLNCVTPGNTIDLRRSSTPGDDSLVPVSAQACPAFSPPPRNRFLQKLTFTFSIGPDF